jgi:hypothetical protein
MKPVTIGTSDAGNVQLDLVKLVSTRALVTANSGGGKSWLLRLIAEKAIGHIQTLILDPEGEFATLREKHDVLLVGAEGEVAADPRTAGLLARKLAELEVSAVIDLSEFHLEERQRFVKIFAETLIDLPKNLRHPTILLLDEAHLFCPEKGAGEAESGPAVIDLAVRGRKRGICLIPATQRLSKLSKHCEAECNNVFIGRTVQDIDQARAAKVLGLKPADALALRDVEAGEFFTFGPAIAAAGVVKFHVGAVATTHPEPGDRHKLSAPKASDAVKQLVAHLADLPQQAIEEARTLSEAKRQITDLQRQLKSAGNLKTVEVASSQEKQPIRNLRKGLDDAMKIINQLAATSADPAAADPEHVRKIVQGAVDQLVKLFQANDSRRRAELDRLRRDANPIITRLQKLLGDNSVSMQAVAVPATPPRRPVNDGIDSAEDDYAGDDPAQELGGGALKRIMQALAQNPEGITDRKLAILADVKCRGSTMRGALSKGRGLGWIEGKGDRFKATAEGLAAMGDISPLPVGEELRRYWQNRLGNGAARQIFDIALASYPEPVTKHYIAEHTDISNNGSTMRGALSKLRGLQLISKHDLVASPVLFEE